jgi:hypothetical protein
MEIVNHFPTEVPWLESFIFIISIGFVFIVFNNTVLNDSAQQPVPFTVTAPEQCNPYWEGEVLEKPSIKVSCSLKSLHDWQLTLNTEVWLERHTMLLPSQWTATRTREPIHSGWNR